MIMGIMPAGSTTREINVSLGCCHNNPPNTLTMMMGSRTMTEVAPLRIFWSEAVSFMILEISWPVEVSL